MAAKYILMTQEQFDEARDLDRIKPETAYKIIDDGSEAYGWSPDGDGFYFYETWAELVVAHGEEA
jgi:hypothetical protein